MRRTVLVTFSALSLGVSSCAAFPFGNDPRPLPSPSTDRRSQDLGEGRARFWPNSVRVEEGVAYQITVYTHCGLDFLLDFDGSFWKLSADPPQTPAWGNPEDSGVITLTGDDTALYRSSQGVEVDVTRLTGPKDVRLCY
jgi:hypothetical protein